MCFLLKINKYILVSILLDWFDLSTFGKLSLAMNGKRLFSSYMEIVSMFSAKLRVSLFPSKLFIPLSASVVQWFEKYGFGTPDSVIIQWSIFDEIDSGLFTLPNWLMSEKYQKRKANRKLLYNCLQKVRCVRIVSYNEGKTLKLGKCVESIEVRNGIPTFSCILLPACGPSIKVLDFTGFKFDSEKYNCQVCRSCPNLTTIIFSRLYAFVQSLLATLLVHCRHLSTLNISTRNDMDERAVQQFIVLCRHCQVIHLPFTNSLTLRSLVGYCSSVQQSLSLLNIHESVLDDVAASFTMLTSLVIRGIYLSDYEFTSPSLWQLASNLTYLDMCETQFDVNYFNSLPDCPQLKTLRLHNCKLTSAVLTRILSRCSKVKNLVVSLNLLDDSIGEALKALPYLEKLNISNHLISNVLFVLGTHCKRLRALDVSNCERITNKGLCSVLWNGRITSLNILGCTLIHRISILCIATQCPDIKMLSLSGSKEFREEIREDLDRCSKCFTYFVIK